MMEPPAAIKHSAATGCTRPPPRKGRRPEEVAQWGRGTGSDQQAPGPPSPCCAAPVSTALPTPSVMIAAPTTNKKTGSVHRSRGEGVTQRKDLPLALSRLKQRRALGSASQASRRRLPPQAKGGSLLDGSSERMRLLARPRKRGSVRRSRLAHGCAARLE